MDGNHQDTLWTVPRSWKCDRSSGTATDGILRGDRANDTLLEQAVCPTIIP